MSDDLKEMFMHEKPARILAGIKRGQDDKYASVLSREADCTYSHTVKVLQTFRDHGLVDFEKEGRKKLVRLTETGEELASGVESLMSTLETAGR